tara:strand:- start:781 stop:1314 length:534 start_codon:yes stop_codon:yes gene_type:complete
MIFFIKNEIEYFINELIIVSTKLNYKNMYYDPNNATSSSTKTNQIKTDLQQYGIKEGSLKLDICQKVCNLFNEDIKIKTVGFVKIEANKIIPKHVDNKFNRSTVFSIPLIPDFENYKPPTFYDFTVLWENKPFFMPTEKEHSVENNNFDRINFQIGFGYPIEKMKLLYQNKKLFKNI